MIKNIARIWAISCLLAGAALADQEVVSVMIDLDQDGALDTYWLEDAGDGSVSLRAENTRYGDYTVPNIAWIGGIGQQPELGTNAAGSLTVSSMNEAIGRNRWHLTLTIAFRRGTFRVVGISYSHYDTLDLDANGSCDLNLLTGRGEVIENGTSREIDAPIPALPVRAWNDYMPVYEFCGFN